MAWPSQFLSQFIPRSAADVYAYARDERNLPHWAAGLGSGIREKDGAWVTDSPMGEVTVTFAPRNELGVLDHEVRLPDGTTFLNPLRVVRNDDGCEVVFTLYRVGDMTAEAHEKDAATVRDDLARLRALLEP